MMKRKSHLLVLFLSIVGIGVFNIKENYAQEVGDSKINAYVIEEETGEITELKVNIVEDLTLTPRLLGNINKSITFEVFAKIPDNGKITSRANSGGDKDSGGVRARVSVNYDLNSKKDQIKVNSYSGSWRPNSNIYQISGRATGVHSGFLAGAKSRNDKPGNNSFFYSTGWGYNSLLLGGNSPRVWADARVNVNGMSGTGHKIVLEQTFP